MSLIVSVLGIVSAIYTMQVYDRVVPTGSLATLFVLTVGVCVSIALEALGRQLKTFLVHRSADQIDQKLGQIFREGTRVTDGVETGVGGYFSIPNQGP